MFLFLLQHAEAGWLDVSTVATSANSKEERQQQLLSFKQVQQWWTAVTHSECHITQVALCMAACTCTRAPIHYIGLSPT